MGQHEITFDVQCEIKEEGEALIFDVFGHPTLPIRAGVASVPYLVFAPRSCK